MWFKFPDGTDKISVQEQEFGVEAKDETGVCYFRAPDHFAPLILDLPGFKRGTPPADAPADLPAGGIPSQTETIRQLSQQVSALEQERDAARELLAETVKQRDALLAEVTKLQAELDAADAPAPAGAPKK